MESLHGAPKKWGWPLPPAPHVPQMNQFNGSGKWNSACVAWAHRSPKKRSPCTRMGSLSPTTWANAKQGEANQCRDFALCRGPADRQSAHR